MAIRTEAVFDVLKKELKNRKIKYEDLAAKLGMSLSGLKKSFSSKDLSLTRLQSICEAMGVSLVHVLTAADDTKVQDVYMTDEQEILLLKNPEVFHLYWKLRFDNVPLHRYTQSTKVSREEIRTRLRKLEKVGLLRFDAKGEIEFSHKGMIRWNNHGPLVDFLNRKWSADLIESILRKKDPKIVLNLALLQLSDASLAQLNNELRELVDRYSARSGKDRFQATDAKLKRVGLLVAADEYEFVP